MYRAATAQGKQGIWLSFFPDGKHGNFSCNTFYVKGGKDGSKGWWRPFTN